MNDKISALLRLPGKDPRENVPVAFAELNRALDGAEAATGAAG